MKNIFLKITNVIKTILANDTVERTYKTFIQAFLGSVTYIDLTKVTDQAYLKGLFIAGFTAGITAVWNIIKNYIDKKLNNNTIES